MPSTNPAATSDSGAFANLSSGLNWIQVVSAHRPIASTWDSNSDELSNAADRSFLIACRKQADLVVTTSRTARLENYRPSKHVRIAVIARGGDYAAPNTADGQLPIEVYSELDAALHGLGAGGKVLLESGLTFAKANRHQIRRILLTVTAAENENIARGAVNDLVSLLEVQPSRISLIQMASNWLAVVDLQAICKAETAWQRGS